VSVFQCLCSVLQARLTKQEEDNERERHRLEDLIARMESQNRDQLRQLDEVGNRISGALGIKVSETAKVTIETSNEKGFSQC